MVSEMQKGVARLNVHADCCNEPTLSGRSISPTTSNAAVCDTRTAGDTDQLFVVTTATGARFLATTTLPSGWR